MTELQVDLGQAVHAAGQAGPTLPVTVEITDMLDPSLTTLAPLATSPGKKA